MTIEIEHVVAGQSLYGCSERPVYAACRNIHKSLNFPISYLSFTNIRTLFARVMDIFLFQHYSLNTVLAIFYVHTTRFSMFRHTDVVVAKLSSMFSPFVVECNTIKFAFAQEYTKFFKMLEREC